MNSKLAAITLVVGIGFSVAAAYADDATETPADSAQAPKQSRVLEGGVKGTAVIFEEGLSQIGMATALIQESSEHIMKEATRKDTVVVRGPNVIGAGMVIPALGGDGGVMRFGDLPIRKDKLERYVATTEQHIKSLQDYINALIIPSEKIKEATATYDDLRATMDEVQQHLAALKELSAQKKLVNIKIAKEGLAIFDAMAKIGKQREALVAIMTAVTDNSTAGDNPPASAQ